MEENTVDLPNKNQVHAVSAGRYWQTDSDVALTEIRDWIDQPVFLATIESLLDYKAKARAGRQESGGQ